LSLLGVAAVAFFVGFPFEDPLGFSFFAFACGLAAFPSFRAGGGAGFSAAGSSSRFRFRFCGRPAAVAGFGFDPQIGVSSRCFIEFGPFFCLPHLQVYLQWTRDMALFVGRGTLAAGPCLGCFLGGAALRVSPAV